MSKGNTTENDYLLMTFQGTAVSWNAITDLYLALHTGDPGEAGSQTTNETSYPNYVRIPVARDATGWDVVGNQASNDDLLQFAQCGVGSATITHVSIGTSLAGAGQILYKGELNDPLAVANLIQPQFAAGALVVTED